MKKILSHSPRTNSPKKGGSGPLISKEHCFTIDRTPHLVLDTSPCSQELGDSILESETKENVLVSPKLTDTHQNSSARSFQQSKITEMLSKSTPISFQTLICSVEDFLASHSQSLESGEVSRIPEAQCFLRLQEYLKLKDLSLFSLKMSKGY